MTHGFSRRAIFAPYLRETFCAKVSAEAAYFRDMASLFSTSIWARIADRAYCQHFREMHACYFSCRSMTADIFMIRLEASDAQSISSAILRSANSFIPPRQHIALRITQLV